MVKLFFVLPSFGVITTTFRIGSEWKGEDESEMNSNSFYLLIQQQKHKALNWKQYSIPHFN